MIVVDSSAILAIYLDEEDGLALARALALADTAVMAAPTKLEILMVTGGRDGVAGQAEARLLLEKFDIEMVEWSDALTDTAAEAFMRFGKGKHPASLNFGDCMAYALAKSLDAGLLYKGGDFSLTDVRSAL